MAACTLCGIASNFIIDELKNEQRLGIQLNPALTELFKRLKNLSGVQLYLELGIGLLRNWLGGILL